MSITLDTIVGSAHSISVTDSTGANALAVAVDGSIPVTDNGTTLSIDDGGGSITVDGSVSTTVASDHVEDVAHVTGDTGSFMLAVRSDVKASTAGATGDYAGLIQDADGDLYVTDTVAQGLLTTIDADTSILAGAVSGTEMQVDIVAALPAGTNNIGDVDVLSMPGIYVEDAASAGGENLMLVGGYRQDADTSPVSADGDFHGFIFNALGELKVSSKLDNTSNSSVVVTTTTVNTTVGGIQLSTPLSGRREVTIQNLGSQDIWVKDGTGVTAGAAGNGFQIPKFSSATYAWGANIDPYAIVASGTSSVKVVESA